MFYISQLYVYPIKSLGGIALNTAQLTSRGLQYDRRWMLIDSNRRFISQRENAQLALFQTEIGNDALRVTYLPDATSIAIPLTPRKTDTLEVVIWDDTCTAQLVADDVDEFFSEKLGLNCRLVYMPDETFRFTDARYTSPGTVTSFSDAYPALLIGQASLDDLNHRLPAPLPTNRFRPNIVFIGSEPYIEDTMNSISINNIAMQGVKLCARCVLTTVDQQTAAKGKEPLKTLATYRRKGNKILFGQNIVFDGEGWISIGDELKVLSTHKEERFLMPKVVLTSL